MSKTENVHIQHAGNDGKYRINKFRVDSYDETNNRVYEFHGCFWHRHPCHLNADLKKWEKKTSKEKKLSEMRAINLPLLEVVYGIK